jgi:predicted Zn-dependent protease
MQKISKKLGVGVIVFLVGTVCLIAGQQSRPAGADKLSGEAAAPGVDHAQAYYHFMLARRYQELAGVYNRSDYVDRAISEYKEALAADPQSLFLRVELAELYWRVARVGDAVHEAEAVLKSNPDYPDAHRLLGRIYWHMLGENQSDQANKESLSKAIVHIEALTRLEPSDTDSWLILGRLYKMNNESQKAEETLKKLLTLAPDSKGALSSLAQLYFEQGDYQGAVELLKKVPEADRDPSLLGMLGYAYSQTHDFESAVACY